MKQVLDWVRPAIKVALAEKQDSIDQIETPSQIVAMHLNENPFGSPLNRYPALSQMSCREIVGKIRGGLRPQCISLTNGTADSVGRLVNTFCMPARDNVVVVQPMSKLYSDVARLTDVEVRQVLLDDNFRLNVDDVLRTVGQFTKMVFLSSPNNPTGNLLQPAAVLDLCEKFNGIVVVDETYVAFSRNPSLVQHLSNYTNLVILDSLSVTYAMASSRIAMILAHPQVIRAVEVLNYPYSLSTSAIADIQSLPRRSFDVDKWTKSLLEERTKLLSAVAQLPICEKVYPTSANFFMAKFKDVGKLFDYLKSKQIAVYNCSEMPGCEGCLRITVGLPVDNNALVSALRKFGEGVG